MLVLLPGGQSPRVAIVTDIKLVVSKMFICNSQEATFTGASICLLASSSRNRQIEALGIIEPRIGGANGNGYTQHDLKRI